MSNKATHLPRGMSESELLIDHAYRAGVIRKSGKWLVFGDDQLGQGVPQAVKFLDDNPDIAEEIRSVLPPS